MIKYTKDNIIDFMHMVAEKKKSKDKWQYFHFVIEDAAVNKDELIQFIEFHFNNMSAETLITDQEIFTFALNKDSLALSKVETALSQNDMNGKVRVTNRSAQGSGLENLALAIEKHVDMSDFPAAVAFRRMRRPTNLVVILDDDMIVLKQMEKILAPLGNVITLQQPEKLFETYLQYAPDLLFLDIHLQTSQGNKLLKSLKQRVDPKAHVIMISSDTNSDMIMDIKKHGANGFIVKPIEKMRVYKSFMTSPTVRSGQQA